jgi:imidazolonepropionase-like amidohydrolase
MRHALVVGLAVLSVSAPLSLARAQPASSADPVVALKAARLFDGKSDRTLADGVVIVRGGKIEAVGSRLAIPQGARVIDLGDATLLPGLIDSHTHLTGESSDNWLADTVTGLRRTVPEQAIRATQFAHRTLLAGFTTVRDVGSGDAIDVGLRNTAADSVFPGPRMQVSVRALGARGGHCDEAGFPYETFGDEPGVAQGIASGADQFRDAVRFAVKYGADVIKICATGGVLSLGDEVDTSQLTQAEMNAIVDEAHRLRKKTAAHAHGDDGAQVAIRAGIDSIEHGSFLSEETLRMMVEKKVYFVPTLLAGEYVTGKAVARQYPPEIAAKAKAAITARSATFKKALQLGVRIAFGTDSGVSPHGLNAQEFALLVDHGMTPAAALKTATANAADLLGLANQIGTLEAGKEADIIAVPGDPMKDIRVMEKVRFVMKAGAVVKNE